MKLDPRVSGADDSVEVLKKVHMYNGLYVTGVFGAFHVRSTYASSLYSFFLFEESSLYLFCVSCKSFSLMMWNRGLRVEC